MYLEKVNMCVAVVIVGIVIIVNWGSPCNHGHSKLISLSIWQHTFNCYSRSAIPSLYTFISSLFLHPLCIN